MSRFAMAPVGAKCADSRPSPSSAFLTQAARLFASGGRRSLGCNCSARLASADPAPAESGTADPAAVDSAPPGAQYFSAGQSWCRFSNIQRGVIEAQPAESRRVEYIDCTQGSATAGHKACLVQAKGFPYVVKCEPDQDCTIVKYGAMPAEQLEQLTLT